MARNTVCNFLSQANCERLILNGDIIDGWSLQKFGAGKWKPQHTRFFKIIMKMMENYGTEVIYIRGNHDDFIDSLAPLKFANLSIVKEYMLESNGRHYFITHGDVFDKVTTQMKWLAKLGDIGYTLLLWLNSQYNRWRIKQGKPYYSLSQEIKQKVKSAVSYISDFEKVLAEFARNRQCEGVICGHIHHPENKMIDNVHYLNSGDWVETMSALTEDEEGNWDILYYSADMDKENTNNENMVLNVYISRITSNSFPHDILPGINQPIFIQRSFKSLLSEKTPQHLSYLFCIIPLHISSSSLQRSDTTPPQSLRYHQALPSQLPLEA